SFTWKAGMLHQPHQNQPPVGISGCVRRIGPAVAEGSTADGKSQTIVVFELWRRLLARQLFDRRFRKIPPVNGGELDGQHPVEAGGISRRREEPARNLWRIYIDRMKHQRINCC